MKKYTVKQASLALECSTSQIYSMIRNGSIPHGKWFKFGIRKGYRIEPDIIEAIKCGLLNTVEPGALTGEKGDYPSEYLSGHPIVRMPSANSQT